LENDSPIERGEQGCGVAKIGQAKPSRNQPGGGVDYTVTVRCD
jgi:hypothetical protein